MHDIKLKSVDGSKNYFIVLIKNCISHMSNLYYLYLCMCVCLCICLCIWYGSIRGTFWEKKVAGGKEETKDGNTEQLWSNYMIDLNKDIFM